LQLTCIVLQARQGKALAAGSEAPHPACPSIRLAGSKRAAPQADGSLLSDLGHEAKLGGSSTISLAQQVFIYYTRL
jgi:hypothetical protein